MIWKSNVWYWTLFCPKYCAPSGAVPSPARTAAAATVPILITCVLSFTASIRATRSHSRRIAPQPLELIERAQIRVKHVHHEVYVIQQDPAALCQSFDVMRGHAPRSQAFDQMLGHAAHVRVRRPRRDHEVVRGTGQPAQIQHQRLDRLAVGQRGGDEPQRLGFAGAPRGTPPPGCSHSVRLTAL